MQSSTCLWLQITHLKLVPHPLSIKGNMPQTQGNMFPQSPEYALTVISIQNGSSNRLKILTSRDFYGGPVADSTLPMQGAQV